MGGRRRAPVSSHEGTGAGVNVVRCDALRLPIRDATVDLIITSPPYFALRSYRDDGEHYEGQIGSEDTPQAFVDALIEATREMARVLKPTGSLFLNLGDKYAGSGGHNNAGIAATHQDRECPACGERTSRVHCHSACGVPLRKIPMEATRRNAPDRYNQSAEISRRIDKNGQRYVKGEVPKKSLMGLPWRYAIGCIDQLGLILRRDLIWHKPNGLPESVTDRCRTSHEYWFHFTKQGRYFSSVDHLREAHVVPLHAPGNKKFATERNDGDRLAETWGDPLGRLPGSVWTIALEPLTIPDWARQKYGLPDHFAAFPQEWPRKLILGWSPSGICTACGEGRRPVIEYGEDYAKLRGPGTDWNRDRRVNNTYDGNGDRRSTEGRPTADRQITGYACACPDPGAPTRPAVVLDPFAGTGTVAMVARALGRTGLSIDLSMDYCRLARWRIRESGHAAKSEQRTWRDAQGAML